MEHILKMLAKKKKPGPDMSDTERHAKMGVLHDLKNQAAKAMGERLHGYKASGGNPAHSEIAHGIAVNDHVFGKGGTPNTHGATKGPGDHESPEHGSVHGEAHDRGPGESYPEHGAEADDHDSEGPGDSHPEHGSVHSESDAHGVGEHHPEHGSVASDSHETGPGDHESPEHGSEGEEFGHLSVEEVNHKLSKLMAHKKRLESKGM